MQSSTNCEPLCTEYMPTDTLPSISNTDLCLIHIIWVNRHSLKPVPLLPCGPFTYLWKLYSSVEAVLSRGGCTFLWRWYFPVVSALSCGICTFMWSRHLPLWRMHLFIELFLYGAWTAPHQGELLHIRVNKTLAILSPKEDQRS